MSWGSLQQKSAVKLFYCCTIAPISACLLCESYQYTLVSMTNFGKKHHQRFISVTYCAAGMWRTLSLVARNSKGTRRASLWKLSLSFHPLLLLFNRGSRSMLCLHFALKKRRGKANNSIMFHGHIHNYAAKKLKICWNMGWICYIRHHPIQSSQSLLLCSANCRVYVSFRKWRNYCHQLEVTHTSYAKTTRHVHGPTIS